MLGFVFAFVTMNNRLEKTLSALTERSGPSRTIPTLTAKQRLVEAEKNGHVSQGEMTHFHGV